MTHSIRFLHTADLHIGAPVRGFRALDDAWSARLQSAIVEAYERVVDAALRERVDFVVVAGDVFDTARPSYGDYLRFFEGLDRLDAAGIPVYLVPGNHDPFTTWKNDIDRLPPSARMLGGDAPEFALFERDGAPMCLIGARGYRNQAWPADEPMIADISRDRAVQALGPSHPRASEAPFSVGIVHTALRADQSKACSNECDLLAADVDYWACGHLHERLVLPSAAAPRVVFPGCIQARDLNESGKRGCYLVTLEREGIGGPMNATLEFVPTASVAFATLQVNVSDCQVLTDVSRLVTAQLFHESAQLGCDELAVRVVLEGATDLHVYLSKPDVLAEVRKRLNDAFPTFYCDTIVDRTQLPRDRMALMREGLFSRHVLRVSKQQRAHGIEMVNYLQAEFVKRGVVVPTSLAADVGAFNDAAEALVLDLLDEEGA